MSRHGTTPSNMRGYRHMTTASTSDASTMQTRQSALQTRQSTMQTRQSTLQTRQSTLQTRQSTLQTRHGTPVPRLLSHIDSAVPMSLIGRSVESGGTISVCATSDPRRHTIKGKLVAGHCHGDFTATYTGIRMYGPIFKFKNPEFEKGYHYYINDRFISSLLLGGTFGLAVGVATSLVLLLGVNCSMDKTYTAFIWSTVVLEIADFVVSGTFLACAFTKWDLVKNNREPIIYIGLSLVLAASFMMAIVCNVDSEIAAAPVEERAPLVTVCSLTAYFYFLLISASASALFPSQAKFLVFFLAFLASGTTIVAGLYGHNIRQISNTSGVSSLEIFLYISIWTWASVFFAGRCMTEIKDRIDFLQYSSARKKAAKMSADLKAQAAKKQGGSTAVEEVLEWLYQVIDIVQVVDTEMNAPELKEASKLLDSTLCKLTNTDELFKVNVQSFDAPDREAMKRVMEAFNNRAAAHSQEHFSIGRSTSRRSSIILEGDSEMNHFTGRGLNYRHTMLPPPAKYTELLDPLIEVAPLSVLDKELNGVVGRGWSLNLLELSEKHPNILVEVGTVLVADAVDEFGVEIEVFQRLFYEIQKRYFDNPYHNATHGATVAHTSMSLCRMLKVDTGLSYGTADEVTFAIAALAHDIGHPGRNNAYLVNCIHPLAVLYNDTAVLENFHCALLFSLLAAPGTDVYQSFDTNVFQRVRSRIVELVLATDMKQHFESQTKFRVRRASPEFDYDKRVEDMWLVLKMCLKAADLSHGALEWSQHLEWSMRVTEEFYRQGDSELSMGLPKSPLCDRDTHKGLAKSQKGFLDFVVHPLYVELDAAANGALQSTCLIRLVENKSRWDERAVLEVVTPIPEAITALSTSTPNVKKLIKELTGAVTYQQSLPAKRSAEEKLTCVKETQTDISDESEGDVELQKGLSDALCKVDSE